MKKSSGLGSQKSKKFKKAANENKKKLKKSAFGGLKKNAIQPLGLVFAADTSKEEDINQDLLDYPNIMLT